MRAIKRIDKKSLKNYKSVVTEITSLQKLDHPNLVKLFEYYETEESIYFVQELLDGEDLYNRLISVERFDESYAQLLFEQIMKAINYIHIHRLSHRDIKPENFVFEDSESDTVKMIDFGLAREFIP